MTAGKMRRYDNRVVEMAMLSTTLNAASVPLWNIATATIMNADDVSPERTFTRIGVPNLLLNTPNQGQKAPSYAAAACTRSDPIIHTLPEVTSATMKARVITCTSTCCA